MLWRPILRNVDFLPLIFNLLGNTLNSFRGVTVRFFRRKLVLAVLTFGVNQLHRVRLHSGLELQVVGLAKRARDRQHLRFGLQFLSRANDNCNDSTPPGFYLASKPSCPS